MPNTEVNDPVLISDPGKSAVTHVVAAVIWDQNDSGHFLISKRQKGKHLQGLWELPGGKTEINETAREALCRELNEELGIDVLEAEPFIEVSHSYPDREILLDVWTVSQFTGEAHSREQQELQWIDFSQIKNFNFPEADLPVLDAIVNSAKAERANRL
ncbi:MAG: 8-oxo-dGTP diphosphatase [Planctomycetota bacterium]|jgi:8-oxo-dGTP diphosphatase